MNGQLFTNIYTKYIPVAQTIEQGASNTKVMDSIPKESEEKKSLLNESCTDKSICQM